MIENDQVKKNPVAVLSGLIRRYHAGTFDPTTGQHIAKSRKIKVINERNLKRAEQKLNAAMFNNQKTSAFSDE